MKKKWTSILAIGALAFALTGCETEFSLSPEVLEAYATSNYATYTDYTDNIDLDYMEGDYAAYTDDWYIELIDLDSTEHAKAWYDATISAQKESGTASGYHSTSSSSSGDTRMTVDGTYYRFLYSDDLCVYAVGEKEYVTQALINLGVVEK